MNMLFGVTVLSVAAAGAVVGGIVWLAITLQALILLLVVRDWFKMKAWEIKVHALLHGMKEELEKTKAVVNK